MLVGRSCKEGEELKMPVGSPDGVVERIAGPSNRERRVVEEEGAEITLGFLC